MKYYAIANATNSRTFNRDNTVEIKEEILTIPKGVEIAGLFNRTLTEDGTEAVMTVLYLVSNTYFECLREYNKKIYDIEGNLVKSFGAIKVLIESKDTDYFKFLNSLVTNVDRISIYHKQTHDSLIYLKNSNEIDETIGDDLMTREDSFRYQMISRLKMDCDYYLGDGDRYIGRLWAGDEKNHIYLMKKLWNSFDTDKKPEWLTMKQILDYEKQMKNDNISFRCPALDGKQVEINELVSGLYEYTVNSEYIFK